MNGFVLRASHFLSHPFGFHPFGPDAGPHASAPAGPGTGPKPASTPPPSTGPKADGDLSWMSLSEDGTAAPPRTDLTWLSLESDKPEDSREDLSWMGLEEP